MRRMLFCLLAFWGNYKKIKERIFNDEAHRQTGHKCLLMRLQCFLNDTYSKNPQLQLRSHSYE